MKHMCDIYWGIHRLLDVTEENFENQTVYSASKIADQWLTKETAKRGRKSSFKLQDPQFAVLKNGTRTSRPPLSLTELFVPCQCGG